MRLPTLFIPHGAGPCFFMEWTRGPADAWARTETFLRGLVAGLPERPKAILVVSGHWEAPVFTVGSGERPGLIFDYYGFPEHTYRLTFDAPGSPALAERVRGLLTGAGITSAADRARGWDHGVFVPLKLVTPQADIPVVQLSLKAGLDPEEHLAAGRALAPLRDEGVLILGSGMSWHNMRGFSPAYTAASAEFDAWLAKATGNPASLARWAEAPNGRLAHPQEEHLIPLMVCAGAAEGEPARAVFRDTVMDVVISAFEFGEPQMAAA
ncbi:extradiol ring-cleavage dioxygenase, class III enzyme, subunit B [Phenylobacterium zucineum HLK1]|uniref:Extradiol ring-cleavage dioxygenase, class III enzyme, subunit B n=1 Tax=Phenylobacterium zucineum (strain HLK1) TaxID=450851 RepID=B4R8F1_PHEZH|nr:class III extradiol ring-cleavage dioxygenase [Phenylobacterium zucineum]ACG77578.1 extradiol ring-cleavage dioxygenase, class III enzyme, subunit B [Phenylobacterium zucineum HLK1]